MSTIDKAIQILEATNDGNLLAPLHLKLVEIAANDRLNEAGKVEFNKLFDTVTAGTYQRPWLHGIEGLTREHQGYIAWRGEIVEHYSFRDAEAEKAAAEKLASTCLMLEEKGIPVNSRTAISPESFSDMPAGSPWLEALLTYYTAFADKNGKCKWLVVNYPGGHAIAMSVTANEVITQYAVAKEFESGAYQLFHRLQNGGFVSCGDRLRFFNGFVSAMEEANITPESISRAINAGFPAGMLPIAA